MVTATMVDITMVDITTEDITTVIPRSIVGCVIWAESSVTTVIIDRTVFT